MFKVTNIKKLFSYNWSDVFKNILPKGKKGTLTSEEQNTLKISSIIGIAASVLVIIAAVASIYNALLGPLAGLLKLSFFDVVSVGELIWTIVKCAIIPIGVLVYNILMGKKEQNGWVIFAMFVLVTLWVVYSFYEGIACIRWIGDAPLSVILGLVGAFGSLLAGGNMVTVFIDYSDRYNRGGQQPAQSNYTQTNGGYTQPNTGYTQPVNEQPSQSFDQPAPKTCPQCGALVKGDAEFCTICGYRF